MPATRKRPLMEMQEEEMESEDVREGSEDMPRSKHSRHRSARSAKRTKAPMDGEGCSCGAGKSKKCSCDGGCGSYKKMDSALTPHEYLAACDMGIQDCSRQYIRSRLDAAERLDKKCGNSGIAENKKCNVGTTASASNNEAANARRVAGAALLLGGTLGLGLAIKERNEKMMQNVRAVRRSTDRLAAISSELKPGDPMRATVRNQARMPLRNIVSTAKRTLPQSEARKRKSSKNDSVYATGFTFDAHTLSA